MTGTDPPVWQRRWAHGRFAVSAAGGFLAALRFDVGGRVIEPLYQAPWIDERPPVADPLLRRLRGEFLCLPFGVSHAPEAVDDPAWREALRSELDAASAPLGPSDRFVHGYPPVHDWQLLDDAADALTIAIDFPVESPIRRVTRTLRPDPDAAALDVVTTIEARRRARRPAGLHPNFALPAAPGSLRIEPARFAFGVAHPAGPEKGVSRALPAADFTDLAAVPLAGGGLGRFDRLPFAFDTEEILLLAGCGGHVSLVDESAGVAHTLTWNADQLPSLLLWMSNRGRRAAPWSGRNLCLGVEPVASAFDLGCEASLAANPVARRGIATALQLDPAHPTELRYRIATRLL